MRKLLLLACLSSVFFIGSLQSQNREFKNAIQAKFNLIDFGQIYNGEIRLGQGFEFGYFRNLVPWVNIGVPLKLGLAKLPEIKENTVISSADLLLTIHPLRSEARINPFLFGGGGYYSEDFSAGHIQIPFGAGINFKVSRYAFLHLQGEYRKAMTDDRDNLQLGLGFLFLLHPSENKPQYSDKDRDGVPDNIDQCPQIAGAASAAGCPDGDLDGVRDTEDECPEIAGPASAKGCPDGDEDGVADKDDDCPEEKGELNGCPDSDGDGIANNMDKCPDESGPASNKGCPNPEVMDSDGDGVPDDKDKCPELAGPNMGCPDSDGDGVADNFDRCPQQKGLPSNYGCPTESDSDNDGVPDSKDKCAGVPGPAANFGCPEIKQETKEKLAFATKAVQFESNRATLKKESYAILDELVKIMEEYPDYKLSISGHTDNIGNDKINLNLSEERAKTCLDYLTYKGVKSERLRSAGYGEARPIAENSTAAGREQNRRVEFELVLD